MNSDASGVEKKDHAAFVTAQLSADGEDQEWEVVVADDMTLMLDYDQPTVPMQYDRIVGNLFANFKQINTYTSRSGNLHILIHLSTPLTALERVAWQAALGSDPIREACHLNSLQKQELNPILLVMKKNRDEKAPVQLDAGRKLKAVL